SLFDPDLGSKWAEISSRYGDRWIYPVVKGSRVIGAMEIWEMSGCLEVRSVDLDSPEMLSDVLTALDKFMEFYRQKGIEIIRIREILSVDAADLDGSVKETLAQFGYVFINGFYAKGRFVTRVMTHDEVLSYIFRKQRLEKTSRFGTFEELIAERGYVRSDQELPCRVAGRTSLKKQMELGTVVKSILCPTYVGYIDPARLPVLRTAKKVPLTGEQVALQKIVAAKQPISKKNLMFQSPYSYKVTTETISEMTRLSLIYQDGDSAYCLAEPADMTQEEALKQIARWHFKDFGIFSAERLAQFLNSRMAVTRKILAELEDEGYISKGFLLEGDPSLYWMLSEDVNSKVRPFTGMFLLNTQDNLSLYLRDLIKKECGSSVSVIFSGTKIIGHFKGKVTPTAAKMEEFEGSDLARKYLEDTARIFGVSLSKGSDQADDDWDASEFYCKTNPGL
ncbi:MAG: ATP-dependent helicase, partial [Candidatus Methanomethylophilus sp.]|nr:ATP-dependent helicase [Methanomethylophilus sp.]